MQIYKVFFKVVYKNLPQIMIYVVVFVSMAAAFANMYSNPVDINFAETKANIAFINYDTDSRIAEGLKNYLSKNANIVNIPDDTKKLQDALFFRRVEYIVRVPEGFTEGLVGGKEVQLEKTTFPGSASGIHLDNIINKYLNTVKIYSSNIENISFEQLLSYVDADLSQETEVRFNSSINATPKHQNVVYYYNYLAYSMFAILILGVCSVAIVFNNKDLKKRNLCSPVRLKNMNFQMVLANISFALLTWFALVFASFIMYRSYMFTVRGLLFLLNSLVFTFAALSISYLIANVIKSRGAMSAAANVVSLGTCFISGIFVPQVFLGKTVLRIASFTPNYWYVKSNNIIADLSYFNMENLAPVFMNMLIIIGFAVAMLSVTLAVIKQRRVSY